MASILYVYLFLAKIVYLGVFNNKKRPQGLWTFYSIVVVVCGEEVCGGLIFTSDLIKM